ncbi:hypothetical protein EXIGLDRAFT_758884 [Exidia glandulosa HHB12029]|uniref:Uncharacterized protein n=1 Tax=Exidia glandulosa HHB12029 TaxID=1314781 RepID=A0A165QFH9_EXIGL|nr:hypothetical protein EXIGLDRAFT_758884 [Exidia glandulosa HHB12029]
MVSTRAQTEADKRPQRARAKATTTKPPPQTKSKPAHARRKVTKKEDKPAKAPASRSKKAPASKAKPKSTAHAGTSGDSTVLEKGIMYFFVRPKVDVGDDPHSADDVARSYLVLRPLPSVDTKDDTGVAPSDALCRILILPKKKLPSTSKHDRFLTFVKAPAVKTSDVTDEFEASTYMTKTKGERTTPAAVPVAEAVYALIASPDDNATHLAYMVTVPDELDAVQTELNIQQQGSFVAQTRNPKFPSPPQAGVPEPAKYSDEIMAQFEGKRWMPLRPNHLAYEHAEVLLIGSSSSVARGGKEEDIAVDTIEKLEEEEEEHVKHIGEEDAVYKDLRLRKDEFKKVVEFGGTWKK